jgi:4a-hydroxytetrahydrobiopterin dehydratase
MVEHEAYQKLAGRWQLQRRPPLLTRRFNFSSYSETRQFLDQLADLSEREGYYPNLSFGKTYVVVSITPQVNRIGLEEEEYAFATQVDVLADQDSS